MFGDFEAQSLRQLSSLHVLPLGSMSALRSLYFKLFFGTFVYVCVYAGMCMHVNAVPTEARRKYWIVGAEVTGSYKLPDVDARN